MADLTETSSEAELIPDRVELPLRIVPKWIWFSAILFVAFLALGVYSQRVHEAPRSFALLSPLTRGLYGMLVFRALIPTFDFVIAGIPLLSAVVMLWIAFASPRWSDRTLWGAAMTFTAFVLALNLQYCFHPIAGEVVRTYPDIAAVVGLVAYGSWLLILRESTLSTAIRRLLSAVCVLAVLAVVGYPLIDPYTRTIDIVGAIALAGALFALGIFVAGRVGVNLLGRTDREAK
jgi:hypothetical protein